LAGLSPAGMAASVAALVRPCSCPASDKLARGAQKEHGMPATLSARSSFGDKHRSACCRAAHLGAIDGGIAPVIA
jgi:hypothetical protein